MTTQTICFFCKRALNIRADGVHQFTRGWVKLRNAGGGHAVALPDRQDLWAHGHCIDRLTSGRFTQDELFGTPRPPPEPPPEPSQSAYLDEHGHLITQCRVCGSPDAPFGYGVHMMKGILGEHYCREHRPENTAQ